MSKDVDWVSKDNLRLVNYCDFLKKSYRSNKKVLFIQTPQIILKSFNPEIAKKKGSYAFPPTGLQYLYEALKKRDLEIQILDLNFMILKKVFEDDLFDHNQWISILEEYLTSFDPYIIGVSCMFDSSIQPLIRILEYIKQRGHSIIVTGGVIASYEWKKLLSRELCHFVIRGEGENKINFLFDQITDENHNTLSTPGIHYKYKNKYYESQGGPDVVAITGDLIDSYSLVPVEEYCKYGSLNPFSRTADIEKSCFAAIQMGRGCRAICSFCSVRDFMGKGVRKRSIHEITREMEFLINKRGIKHFEWLDDDLLFYKKDFQHLLSMIIERKWNITWSANNGLIATSIDEKMLKLMRDSGCIGFKVGIETGNAEMLKKIRKPAKLDDFRNLSRILNNFPEIFVGDNFIIGFPGEKFHQLMDTFRFSLELNFDWAAFTMCQAIRGASAFSDFEDYFDEQINSDGTNTKNFIPARESINGELSSKNKVLKGLDVFKISPDSVPDEEQIREIWLTFNLVVNFINNKNLKPDGRVKKFINWVEMAQVAYPVNPYMSLFLSLAYTIQGNPEKVNEYYIKAVEYHKTDYYMEIFVSFGLLEILNNFPKDAYEVFKSMERLRTLSSKF